MTLSPRTLAVLLLASALTLGCPRPAARNNNSSDGGDGGSVSGDGGSAPVDTFFDVTLTPETASSAVRRVNFAVPLPPGLLSSADRIEVKAGGVPLATARKALASWPDGSLRSVQLQVELEVTGSTTLSLWVDAPKTGGTLSLVPVEQTLTQADGTMGPAVWVTFPAEWLSASRVAGPAVPSASVTGPAAAWSTLCDYDTYDVDAFLAVDDDTGNWLFDRPTSLYRGYQRTGGLGVLKSAYREAAIYRAGLTGSGTALRIGVPGAAEDLKYHYTQGMAVHYLLTGDERFREAAEAVAERAHVLWPDPGYAGGADFWTERHAGFALLAYEWAAAVSDDKAATYTGWSKTAVTAYLSMQDTFPAGYTSTTERCFAHHADAHSEPYGYVGCSPWMSAILADGLDAYADRLARSGDASGAAAARASLVKLGRFIAAQGRDPEGRPYYWAGVGTDSNEVDTYEEHWGESAYLVAMAWHWSGKTDAALKAAADALVNGLEAEGTVGQIRSFNWQCRSGVMGPYYLQP
jgi:hypothetical protein